MRPVPCAACGAPTDRRAAISVEVTGDEYVYTWFSCRGCGTYTVEAFLDRFLGESEVHFLPPMPAETGAQALALIAACPDPGDKHCGCPSHEALYYGVPRA